MDHIRAKLAEIEIYRASLPIFALALSGCATGPQVISAPPMVLEHPRFPTAPPELLVKRCRGINLIYNIPPKSSCS